MKISKIRIKNYRSIRSEISISYEDNLVLVGPNNSGKTNILEAINLFFSSDIDQKYSISEDLPFDSSGEQTSIIVYFSGFSEDSASLHSEYSHLLTHLEGGPALQMKYLFI